MGKGYGFALSRTSSCHQLLTLVVARGGIVLCWHCHWLLSSFKGGSDHWMLCHVPLQFVPQLAAAVRDSNVHVKLAAERAMMHALEIHTNADALTVTLDAHCGSCAVCWNPVCLPPFIVVFAVLWASGVHTSERR